MAPYRACLWLCLGLATGRADDAFFDEKVRPILESRCYECHSASHKVKGGLRLDVREGWAAGGDAGPAIQPGRPDDSLVITAVRYEDSDLRMPPKRKLPSAEIAVLEEWVRRGAPDPRDGPARLGAAGVDVEKGRRHWSYQPLSSAPAAAPADPAWARTEVDRFLLASWEKAGARPTPDAGAETVARRLWFRLVGLPPTPGELAAFVAEHARDPAAALAKAADRLLASPQFGEHWGRHWLDVARFAESSGGGRTLLFQDAWRYRDYVIEAFNQDRPFADFIREQIAGDLLPAATPVDRRRAITATGFLALGPTNYEEQDKQQLRFDIIDEQLDTLGRAFLGQTIGCARCHDHKFDPISQRDYHALAGIFANTHTLHNTTDNVARWIDVSLPVDPQRETELAAQEARIAAMKSEQQELQARLKRRVGEEEKRMPDGQALPVSALAGVVVDDADAKAVGEWRASTNQKTYIGAGYRHDVNEGKGAKTLTFVPAIPEGGRYEVRLSFTAAPGRAANVPVLVFHADGEATVTVDQTQPPPLAGRFISLGVYRFEKDGAGFVMISNEGTRGYVVVDAVQFLPEGAMPMEALPSDAVDVTALRDQVKALETRIKAERAAGPRRPRAMSVRAEPKPADTHIRVRGIESMRGASVPRGFPAVFPHNHAHPIPADAGGRLELANWLADPANPLTSRVTVNRIWTWLYGEGLVRSVDNFGTTGDLPTHPELLDHLARRFLESGGSTKTLVRELVLSRAWALESRVDPAARG